VSKGDCGIEGKNIMQILTDEQIVKNKYPNAILAGISFGGLCAVMDHNLQLGIGTNADDAWHEAANYILRLVSGCKP
jgi:hypothetical protein